MDFYDEPRPSTRLHYDDMPYDSVEETDDAFYSMTDVIYSFPKCECASCFHLLVFVLFQPFKKKERKETKNKKKNNRKIPCQQYGWHAEQK